MKKLILFDFEGVLKNHYDLHYELSSKQFKDLTKEEHKKLFEGNIHVEREKLKHRDTGFDIKGVFNKKTENTVIKKDIKEILIKLSKDYTLGIVTSAKEDTVDKYLKYNEIRNLFSFIFGLETHKLKIKKFKMSMKKFNVKNNEILFITDTLGDILESNKLNIPTIAVDFGYHEKEILEKGHPLGIISKFEEILEFLN